MNPDIGKVMRVYGIYILFIAGLAGLFFFLDYTNFDLSASLDNTFLSASEKARDTDASMPSIAPDRPVKTRPSRGSSSGSSEEPMIASEERAKERNITISPETKLSIGFYPPTPSEGETVSYRDVTINASLNGDSASCLLIFNTTVGLWTNVSHLGIHGGKYDYNASSGVNGLSSFNMNNLMSIASSSSHACYILSNGSSVC